jgi:signal transduction histidine kinase
MTEESIAEFVHTIRTPLSIIVGYADLIDSGKVSEAELKHLYVSKILDRARYIDRKLSELTITSTPEARNELRRCDLKSVVANFVDDINAVTTKRSKQLQYFTDLSSCVVRADSEDMIKILGILYENALKYKGDDATVQITLTEDVQGKIQMIFRDNGSGISSEETEMIFEKGVQGSNSDASSGSGLGLYYVKTVVESYGGSVWAQSAPGEGLAVYITLIRAYERRRV